jgi:hypothetical protein
MDERYFLKGSAEASADRDAGFEFEAEKNDDELDVDNI